MEKKSFYQFKEDQKVYVSQLKEKKLHHKNVAKGKESCGKHYDFVSRGWIDIDCICKTNKTNSHEARLRHIAYSLMKGRAYEQIEKPREQNRLTEKDTTWCKSDWTKIKEIQDEYEPKNVYIGS